MLRTAIRPATLVAAGSLLAMLAGSAAADSLGTTPAPVLVLAADIPGAVSNAGSAAASAARTRPAMPDVQSLPARVGEAGGIGAVSEHLPEIRNRLATGDVVGAAGLLSEAALTYTREGNYRAARIVSNQAILMQQHALGADHPDLAPTLGQLAIEIYLSGDSLGAIEPALRAESISRERSRLFIQSLDEERALRAVGRRESYLDLALTLAALSPGSERVAEVWSALIRSRALVLDELASRHRSVLLSQDSTLILTSDSLAAARARLSTLVLAGPRPREDTYPDSVAEARDECARLELGLAGLNRLFGADLERRRTGHEEVLAGLSSGDAIVSFAHYRHLKRSMVRSRAALDTSWRYIAFIARSGDATPRVVSLGEGAALDSAAARWHQLASEPAGPWARDPSEGACSAAGRRLRELIWDPLAAALSGAGRVFVVPDGMLQLVNFAALPDRDSSYLVESAPPIQLLSAERDVVASAATPLARGLLALGGADYDALPVPVPDVDPASPLAAREGAGSDGDRADGSGGIHRDAQVAAYRGSPPACGGLRSVRFGALPATSREVDDIAESWRAGDPKGNGPAWELTGRSASENAVRRRAPGARVVHLATHGFFLADRCGASPTDSMAVLDPLLLSGLVFAGANVRHRAADPGDDGILSAEEVSSLDLSSVDLVVLSACNTARGVVRPGEGVMGLRRAFAIAGARSVVMTLWSVDDRSARTWMRALYDARFARGEPLPEAVRSASRRMLSGLRERGESTHPFHWAAFVASGGSR